MMSASENTGEPSGWYDQGSVSVMAGSPALLQLTRGHYSKRSSTGRLRVVGGLKRAGRQRLKAPRRRAGRQSAAGQRAARRGAGAGYAGRGHEDRKSTRLNSSHL